jgi:hypothetical protein
MIIRTISKQHIGGVTKKRIHQNGRMTADQMETYPSTLHNNYLPDRSGSAMKCEQGQRKRQQAKGESIQHGVPRFLVRLQPHITQEPLAIIMSIDYSDGS